MVSHSLIPRIDHSVENATSYLDIAGLNALKRQSTQNDPKKLRAVAEQFESIFLNMMLKNMRGANEVFSKDNVLGGEQTEFYQELLDHQISVNMGKTKSLGLADMMIKQIESTEKKSVIEK